MFTEYLKKIELKGKVMQRLEHLFAGQLMFSYHLKNVKKNDHKNVLVIVMQIRKNRSHRNIKNVIKM